jgi:enoyl-CoA hydratase/carnithine racemase
MTDVVISEARDGIGWIVMNRPPLNVVNAEMCRLMRLAVDAFDADDVTKAIVITSAGEKAFGAGADVGEHTQEKITELSDEMFALFEVLRRADGKPRLAVVKGICSGGGNEVAQACDFVIARADARFSQPEINIGAFGIVGCMMMARNGARSKILELGLTGDWIGADEARSLGAVAQLFAKDGFDEALNAYLDKYRSKSTAALRLGRGAYLRNCEKPLDEALPAVHHWVMEEAIKIEDYDEGVSAFLEKRKPVWKNR